jgi:4-amino-4-deoxy-L-arabinose transferase-like glycosyltransferase
LRAPYPLLAVVIFVAACLPLLTKYPAPGGDEPGFVDAALTLSQNGYLGTHLYDGLLPGIDRHVYWQPPLYFVALAGWFRLFGAGLVQARTFSMLCAAVIVVLVYALSRRHAQPRAAFGASVLCAISFWLTYRAATARMDTLCVALSLGSLLTYQRGGLRLAGLLSGLAFLAHPLGVVPMAVILAHQLLSGRPLKEMGSTMWPFGVCCGAWLAYAGQDWQAFRLQMAAQLTRKQQGAPYWSQFWMARTHVFTLSAVLGATIWLVADRSKRRERQVPFLATAIAFVASTFAHEAGYFLYFFPLACIALAAALNERRTLVHVALAAALANELVVLGYNIQRYSHRDYARLTREVRAVIPPNSTVFIGFPEVTPYFSLVGRNPMSAAVPVRPEDAGAHARAAADADFIFITPPEAYLPEVAALVTGRSPLAEIDQGPGYRISIFAGKR